MTAEWLRLPLRYDYFGHHTVVQRGWTLSIVFSITFLLHKCVLYWGSLSTPVWNKHPMCVGVLFIKIVWKSSHDHFVWLFPLFLFLVVILHRKVRLTVACLLLYRHFPAKRFSELILTGCLFSSHDFTALQCYSGSLQCCPNPFA